MSFSQSKFTKLKFSTNTPRIALFGDLQSQIGSQRHYDNLFLDLMC